MSQKPDDYYWFKKAIDQLIARQAGSDSLIKKADQPIARQAESDSLKSLRLTLHVNNYPVLKQLFEDPIACRFVEKLPLHEVREAHPLITKLVADFYTRNGNALANRFDLLFNRNTLPAQLSTE